MKTTSLATAAAGALLIAFATPGAEAAPSIATAGAIKSDAGRIETVTYGWHQGCYSHWSYRHWGYRRCHWDHQYWGGSRSWGHRRWGHYHWRPQHWSGWRSHSRY